jgi:hypothetical protein
MQLLLSILNYQPSRVISKLKSFRQWRRCLDLGIDGKEIPHPKGYTVTAKQHEVLPTSEPTRSFSSPTGEPSGEPAPLLPVTHTRIISFYLQEQAQSLSLHGDENGGHIPAWHASLRGKENSGLESSYCQAKPICVLSIKDVITLSVVKNGNVADIFTKGMSSDRGD